MVLQVEEMAICFDQSFGNVLQNISMDFGQASITGILGRNGSGKSTLMRTLMGLNPLKQGRILYNGRELGISKKELYRYRQEVAMVFQDPDQQLFSTIVWDDVALALRNLGVPETECSSRVTKALEVMDILTLKDYPIAYLSYGQKKRVAIASILALQPRYLLLDEPTAGLDPEGRTQMLALIQNLAQKGVKVVLSSHDMDLMYACCDYAYVLDQGQICLAGTKETVFMEREKLRQAGLDCPWLVRLHLDLGFPLYRNEQEFEKESRKIQWPDHL
ncbi:MULTISPECIES: energy-coupling factor ABC transporter ATP-binding protein [unclassified Streptococcus]|uniref:energy-coupling factor ABC transporter ATP-binding protein n=1 Tax=unclassified Streptococcus TaxID=2608887 RepID=UPI00107275FA|nr:MULTISPECIES: ATP-binding cassette domain-containing protein [unclassified Streptococcus]MBF0805569.1 ATP-binding cassette domain-containing protein [Streptococcus sp. 19428wA2_WM07]TFU28937.1 ATP-binding cassette domain-containing protein [Streptococcus sp. WM07]